MVKQPKNFVGTERSVCAANSARAAWASSTKPSTGQTDKPVALKTLNRAEPDAHLSSQARVSHTR